MQYVIYFILIGIIIILFLNRKKLIQQAKDFDNLIESLKRDGVSKYIEEQKEKLDFEIRFSLRDLESQQDELRKDIQIKRTMLDEMTQRAEKYEEQLRSLALGNAKRYEETLMNIAKEKVDAESKAQTEAAMKAHEELMTKLTEEAANAQSTIASLTQTIEQFALKQKAINEAIARQRLLEEQQDFYRICLTEDAISDVSFLREVRKNLKKPEIIDKIIYDNYIGKPVLEMIKRVLQNTTCSGIYKITCTKTGEIYIGKSTDVKSRWQQHCKSAFNCGTIAHSLLHTKMRQHGIENFTFELVEQVPKEQLSEREKFYINFYQTKEIGLNERSG